VISVSLGLSVCPEHICGTTCPSYIDFVTVTRVSDVVEAF